MKIIARTICVATTLAVAGCGGSSTPATTSGGVKNAYAFTSVEQAGRKFDRLVDKLDASNPTRPQDVASRGTARHDGLVAVLLNDSADDGVVGTVRINTNLANGAFTGSAGSFYDIDGRKTSGSLQIAGKRRVNDGVLVTTSNVSGKLTFGSGQRAVTAKGAGGVGGKKGNLVTSLFTGNAKRGSSVVPIAGVWIAEQQ